jgi:hypothetical protein
MKRYLCKYVHIFLGVSQYLIQHRTKENVDLYYKNEMHSTQSICKMHGGKWDLVGTVLSWSAIGAQVLVSNLGVDCMRIRRNKLLTWSVQSRCGQLLARRFRSLILVYIA